MQNEKNNNMRKLSLLRFFSYLGSASGSIASPVLMYTMTHSLTMTGLALLVEWLPKSLMYIFGGQLAAFNGIRQTVYTLDYIRAGSYGFMLFNAVYLHSVIGLMLTLPFIQISNAIQNLVFEGLLGSTYKTQEERIKGNASLVRIDMLATGIMVLVGLIFQNLYLLLVISTLVMLFNALWIHSTGKGLFSALSKEIGDNNKLSFNVLKNNVVVGIQFLKRNPPLLKLLLLSMAINMPIIATVTGFPFIVNEYLKSQNVMEWQSIVKAMQAFMGVFFLSAVVYGMKKQFLTGNKVFKMANLMVLVGSAGMLFADTFNGYLLAFLCSVSGSISYTIWYRDKKQALIPDEYRLSLSGLLIAIDTLCYSLIALVMAMAHGNLQLVLSLSAALLLMAVWVVWKDRKAIYQIKSV